MNWTLHIELNVTLMSLLRKNVSRLPKSNKDTKLKSHTLNLK